MRPVVPIAPRGRRRHSESRRYVSSAAVVVLAIALAVGCSSPSEAGGSGTSSTSASTSAPAVATSTTPPEASSPLVEPVIQKLLVTWDRGLTAVLADPRPVARSGRTAAPAMLTGAFTEDSPYIETLGPYIKQGFVDEGRGARPGPHGTVQSTSLLRITQRPDADHVRFVFCTYNDGVDFTLSTGKALPAAIGIVQGSGEADRTPKGWRLSELQQISAVDRPAGTPNPCPALARK